MTSVLQNTKVKHYFITVNIFASADFCVKGTSENPNPQIFPFHK